MAGATAGLAATGVLSACGLFDGDDPPPAPDPLAPLLADARGLAARHEAAAAAHPALADRLTPIAQAHRAHEAELVRVTRESPSPSPSGVTGMAPQVPAEADAALAELRTAEEAGHKLAQDACLAAPAERAALLGSITAARATHLEVL
ncbi:hypothetical protein AB0M79_05355 [Polymorphospora sp. NPDC051019]|uniref:hypothetical protein n=1 Tax=Polymorphospora sp. NPDC051019 TaxID=3155725 RepID=UPI003428435C